MSEGERFAVKRNYIKRYLDCLNRFGEAGWELDSVDEDWQLMTFKRIDQRVTYYLLDGGGLGVSYLPLKGKIS